MGSNKKIILLGTGSQAREYLKVLVHLELSSLSIVWGRSPEKLAALEADFGVATTSKFEDLPTGAEVVLINALASDVLFEFTTRAIASGVTRFLVEKPICLYSEQMEKLFSYKNIDIGVALNRRHFPSIKKVKELISSGEFIPNLCFFDFTELSHLVVSGNYSNEEKSRWALVNSIHVFDSVKFMLGDFQWENKVVLRQEGLSWHPSGSAWVFQGKSGKTPVVGVADWCAPGRWNIELNSENRKIKLSPMEVISYMDRGSFEWKIFETSDEAKGLKPGLLSLVTDVLKDSRERSISWAPLKDYKTSFDSVLEAFEY